jgi:ATP-dependent Zn protease
VTDHNHSELERAAYHEAGHAVAAYALGRRFTRVTLEVGGGSLGRCGYAERRNFDPDLPDMYTGPQIGAVVEHQIMGYLAGPIAEGILVNEKSWRETGGAADVPRAVDLAMYLLGDIKRAEDYMKRMWDETEELIRRPENWAAVQAMAEELLERGQVEDERAREIIDGAQQTHTAGQD